MFMNKKKMMSLIAAIAVVSSLGVSAMAASDGDGQVDSNAVSTTPASVCVSQAATDVNMADIEGSTFEFDEVEGMEPVASVSCTPAMIATADGE